MTNWEKYKKYLLLILTDHFGVDKHGEMIDCCDFDCDDCIFDAECKLKPYDECFVNDCTKCDSRYCANEFKLDWLNAEYIEPKDHLEVATLIAFLRQEPNQMKHVKSIKIVNGMPVINGGE